jgi:hypothetical protein
MQAMAGQVGDTEMVARLADLDTRLASVRPVPDQPRWIF